MTRRLMTHPGVGPLTALAYELVIGTPERFHCGKQIASYVGLVPTEESSGDRRRLGHISKQGNVLLRFLLVEAAQVTVRSQAVWRSTILPPRHATRTEDREGGHGSQAGGASVLDVASRVETTASCTSSVRTRESPEIAMVCSKSPT